MENGSVLFLTSKLSKSVTTGFILDVAAFLGPVVQSIVSLTTSLRGYLVKYIPTTLSNSLLFLLEKCENLLLCIAKDSHIFPTKITVYL